jgi:PEGA domain
MKKLISLATLAAALGMVGCAAPRTTVETANVSGTMLFKVKPTNADVAIDGNVIGKARDFDGSTNVAKVGPGKHVVLVSAPGYKSWESRVYLSDTQEKVEVDLQKEGN